MVHSTEVTGRDNRGLIGLSPEIEGITGVIGLVHPADLSVKISLRVRTSPGASGVDARLVTRLRRIVMISKS